VFYCDPCFMRLFYYVKKEVDNKGGIFERCSFEAEIVESHNSN